MAMRSRPRAKKKGRDNKQARDQNHVKSALEKRAEDEERKKHAEKIMLAEEEMEELESRANSLVSDYAERGGVSKSTRVDAPHSKFISAGGFHSAAVDDEGMLWTWGRNQEGQLGLGGAAPSAESTTKPDVLEPQAVSLDHLGGKHVRQVTCGVRVSAAVDEDGALWTWGDGKAYLGHEDIHLPELGGSYDVSVPRRMRWPASVKGSADIRVASVSLGWSHTVVLDDTGSVYTWGFGGNGRLGHGDEQTRVGPARVLGVPPHEVAAVAAGGAFTVARSKSGLALAWGAAHCTGQGELGSRDDLLTPEIIPKTKELDVAAVAAGGLHAALLTRDGAVFTWGWGECGQLGLGRRVAEVVREPTQVDTQDLTITMVACGAYHTALVEEGGELMTFGAGGKRWVATEETSQQRPGSKGSVRSGLGSGGRGAGEDGPGAPRDKQGFTKAEREAFNLELAAKAMNIKTMSGAGNDKMTEQAGYREYVIQRREKIPDGTIEFKRYLEELEKEEKKKQRMRNILKREGETDDEINEQEAKVREAEWDRRMEMQWNRLMVWVKYSMDASNPMRVFRQMGCCIKPAVKEEENSFQGPRAVRSKDDVDAMALARELDGKHGEMCRLGFAGVEELREEGAGDRVTPRVVTGPWRLRARSRVVGVSCGPYHTLAVTESGEVYAFGVGMNGRLGTGDAEARGTPTHVATLSRRGVSVGQPGRRMGLTVFSLDARGAAEADDRGAGNERRAPTQGERQVKLARAGGGGGGGGADGYRAASLPNRGRGATVAGAPGARASTPSTAANASRDNGGDSPPPELDEDDIEAFTGAKSALRGRKAGPRRTVIDDILGPPTLGLPKV